MPFDLLIRGGVVLDGSGAPGRPADVGVQNDRITAVGVLDDAEAATVVDATDRVVAPGFIDVHNHSDGYFLRDTHLPFKTQQGFTTEILMSDGVSYAPVDEHTWREWLFYLRSLNGLQVGEYRGWRRWGEYMALLDGANVQNSAGLAPYGNIRSLACGFRPRPVDDFQRRTIQFLIRETMAEGALGLSTGLDYLAQTHASTDDLVDACRAMQPFDGLYVTHVRYKLGLLPALREAFTIARRAEVRLHISHLKAQSPQEIEQVLALLDREGEDVDYSFDVYPYQPGSTMLSYLLPYNVWDDGPLAAMNRLADPQMLTWFRQGLASYRLDLDEIRFAWIASKHNADCLGMSLQEYVDASGLPAEEALSRLLLDEGLAALLVFVEGEDKLVEPFLQHPKYMMGSDGIYFPGGVVHPRVFGSAPRLLGPCVRDLKLFSVEEAVRKMTSWPADRFGLRNRGVLSEGAFADLVVFDPETVADRATYEEPQQMSIGIDHLVVNGQVVRRSGELVSLEGPPPGRAILAGRE